MKSVRAAAYRVQACALSRATTPAPKWDNLLPIVLFLVGYFATGALQSEGLRYTIAIAAFLVGIIPAIICDRRTKKNGKLTFTIVRLF